VGWIRSPDLFKYPVVGPLEGLRQAGNRIYIAHHVTVVVTDRQVVRGKNWVARTASAVVPENGLYTARSALKPCCLQFPI